MKEPYKHQTQAYERFKEQPFGALFLEQGLGKSKIAIDIAEYKFGKGDITGILVITPKSLVDNWALIEIPKHRTFDRTCIVPWRKKPLEFRQVFAPVWFIANIDAVIRDNWVAAFRAFYSAHKNFMLIIDESTTVKTPKAQRSERMMQVADYAKARFILSGTPITNSPLDIWQQAEILLPGLMGYNYFLFKQRYAVHKTIVMGMKSFQKVVGYQHLPELTEKIKKFAVIAKKRDCLDLPPKIPVTTPIEFTVEQKKHYNELKKQALTIIDNQEFNAVNAISLINMLLQICAGQIKKPDGSYIYLDTNRIDLLSDLMEESDEKSLIWCAFVGAADAIEKAMPTNIMRIRAETPDRLRNEILSHYERTEDKIGLLLNQASMGKGHTILEGRNMVYFAQRFSVEQRVQSEDRPDRIGQTKSVIVNQLYTPETVEEKVIKVLTDNRELADRIITDKNTLREFIS